MEKDRNREKAEWMKTSGERGRVKMQKGGKCVKGSGCSFESSLRVLAGHHSAVRSTFPGQPLLVTLMAWKEDRVTLSPRRDANTAVAFVSSAPSPLHNSLEVTNWSWETGFFCVLRADEQCEKKPLIKRRGVGSVPSYCLLQSYLISPHKSNITTL